MKTRFCLIAAFAALILSSCCSSSKGPKAKHVVFIGIDGFASWCLQEALDGDATIEGEQVQLPNIKEVMAGGAYTLRKRSVMPSASAINWASIFNGIPTEMHGYNEWNSREPAITAAEYGPNGMPTTVYTVLRAQRPEAVSGAIYNWDGIGYVIDTVATSYHKYDGSVHSDPAYTTQGYTVQALEYIVSEKPAFFTLYFDELDSAGHNNGWGTEPYYRVMQTLDECIGLVIQGLKDAGMWNDTILVITSDHGGKDRGHGGFTIQELESPYLVCGKNILPIGEIPSTMMQYDVAANFAHMLGLTLPAHWRGRQLKEIYR